MKVTAPGEAARRPAARTRRALLRYALEPADLDGRVRHAEARVPRGERGLGARVLAPLPPAEMDGLRQQLAGRKVVLEHFFAHHHDGVPA